jgi:hypothetical protein
MLPDPDEIPPATDSSQPSETPPPSPPRAPRASSTAVVVRESDRMRTGIDAGVLDVSTGTLSLSTQGRFAVDEQVKIRLRNVVQRFEKETRGLVQKIESDDDGSTTLTIELLSRLSALEVSLVKMGIPSPNAGSGSEWV